MIAGSASFTNVPVHGVLPVGVSTNVGRGPDRVEHRQALGVGDLAVDLAERGREVHDAGAVVDGDEVGGDDARRVGVVEREQRRTGAGSAGPTRSATATGPTTAASSPSTSATRAARHHEVAPRRPRAAHAHVLDVGADRGADVRHERPRRGGPHEEVEVALDEREAHVDRRLGDVAVRAGLAELVARQRGAAAPAVGDDLVALVDVAGVPHLAEQPPHALDVASCRASSRRRRCRATCRCAW